MAVSGSTWTSLFQTALDSKFAAVTGTSPLGSPHDQSWFKEYCQAIATGLALSVPSITFTTNDTGSGGTPDVTGSGTGTGIMIETSFFTEAIYTGIRQKVLDLFGVTGNAPYPPATLQNGLTLNAIAEALAESSAAHLAAAASLTSTHPKVYTGSGTISDGQFSGLSGGLVQSNILASAPRLAPHPFFAATALAIGTAFTDTIQQHSTGMVTISGTCTPSDSQSCGVSKSGTGSGTVL